MDCSDNPYSGEKSIHINRKNERKMCSVQHSLLNLARCTDHLVALQVYHFVAARGTLTTHHAHV